MKRSRRKFSASFRPSGHWGDNRGGTKKKEKGKEYRPRRLRPNFELPPTQIQVGNVNFGRNAAFGLGRNLEKEDPDLRPEPLYNKIGKTTNREWFFKEKSLGKMWVRPKKAKGRKGPITSSRSCAAYVKSFAINQPFRSLLTGQEVRVLVNLKLMKEIDPIFCGTPHYGVERMTDYQTLDLGYRINIKSG